MIITIIFKKSRGIETRKHEVKTEENVKKRIKIGKE